MSTPVGTVSQPLPLSSGAQREEPVLLNVQHSHLVEPVRPRPPEVSTRSARRPGVAARETEPEAGTSPSATGGADALSKSRHS